MPIYMRIFLFRRWKVSSASSRVAISRQTWKGQHTTGFPRFGYLDQGAGKGTFTLSGETMCMTVLSLLIINYRFTGRELHETKSGGRFQGEEGWDVGILSLGVL